MLSNLSIYGQIADRFDYPIGDRGLDVNSLPYEFPEGISNHGGENNQLYPYSMSTSAARLGTTSNADEWYNRQDVGSYYYFVGSQCTVNGYHPGEDWNFNGQGEVGKPVYSIANGEVIKTGNTFTSGQSAGGQYVVIKHTLPNGTIIHSIYVHIGNLLVNTTNNNIVTRGQQIGEIADITSLGDHLHFEIRVVNSMPTTLWENGPCGYYPDDQTMLGYGIVDASDFIDQHRIIVKEINNNLDIYAGPRIAPLNKIKIWVNFPSGGSNFTVSNLKVNNFTPNGGFPITNKRYNGIASNAIFELNLTSLASSIGNNYGPYNIQFDITYNNQTVHYSSEKLYFLDYPQITDVPTNAWSGEEYIGRGIRNGLFKGFKNNLNQYVFKPNDVLTNGQLAKVVVSALLKLRDDLVIDISGSQPNGTYTSSELFPYIMTAKNNGWLPIDATNTFNQDDPVVLGNFAFVLNKAFGLTAYSNTDKARHYLNNTYINTGNLPAVPYLQHIKNLTQIFYEVDEGVWKKAKNFGSLFSFNIVNNPYSLMPQKDTIKAGLLISRSLMAKVMTNVYMFKASKMNLTYNSLVINQPLNYFVIGDEYESIDEPIGNIPALSTQLLSSYTIDANQTLTLSHASDYDANNGGIPQSFYWTVNGGDTLMPISNNFRSVKFVPENVQTQTTYKLYTSVTNTNGKIREYHIDVVVNPINQNSSITPTQQATNLQISNVTTNSIDITWTRGNGSACLVTACPTASNVSHPQSYNIYVGNSNYSQAGYVNNDTKILYTGSGSSMTIDGLQANTGYKIFVYEFNGTTTQDAKYLVSPLCFNVGYTSALQNAIADFSWSANPIVDGVPYSLINNSSNSDTYQWSVTPNASISNTSIINPSITFPSIGTYTVTLDVANSLNGTSDTKVRTIEVLNASTNLPDIISQGISLNPISVLAGQNTTITCNVSQTNPNVINVPSSMTVVYHISSDQILDNNDWAAGQEIISLGSNPSQIVTHSVNVPNTFSGNYYILVSVDYSGYIVESNENNNVGNIPVSVVGAKCDLVTTNVSTSLSTVASGQVFSVTGTFGNIGQVYNTAGQGLFANIYISNDNILSKDDYLTSRIITPSNQNIYPNQLATGTISNFNLPSDWPSGNYYLIVAIDFAFTAGYGWDFNSELDESNNYFSTLLSVSNPNQPSTPPTNIYISNKTSNSVRLNWTNGSGNKRLVIGKRYPVPLLPIDNTVYTANSSWQNASFYFDPIYPTSTNFASRILYFGTGNYVDINDLPTDSTFYFAVYEANDQGGGIIDYLQANNILSVGTHFSSNLNQTSFQTLLNGSTNCKHIQMFDTNVGVINTGYVLGKTLDGGDSWSYLKAIVTSNFSSSGEYPEKVYFFDANLGIYGSNSGNVFKTINGGLNWTRMSLNNSEEVYQVICVSATKYFVSVGENSSYGPGKIYVTNDGGATWQVSLTNNYQIHALTFLDLNNGYALDVLGKLFKTSNGGISWTNIQISSSCNYQWRHLSFTDINHGWAMNVCNDIFKTTDAGQTWSKVYTGNQIIDASNLQAIDDQHVFCNYKHQQFIKSSDGGNTWVANNFPNNIGGSGGAIYALDNNTIFVGAEGVFKTTTSGEVNGISFSNANVISQLCPNETINCNYLLQGNYSATNQVLLELSDINGSFANPIQLAATISNNGGLLQFVVPSNLPASSHYKLRMTTTSPVTISNISQDIDYTPSPMLNFISLPTSVSNATSSIILQALPYGGIFKVDGLVSSSFNPTTLSIGNHQVKYEFNYASCISSIEQTIHVYEQNAISITNYGSYNLCAGSLLHVPFNLSGIFNSSTNFIAQISSSSGSFFSPINLGSITTTSSDTMHLVLPNSLAFGSNYFIRIGNSDGTVISNLIGPFTINPMIIPAINISSTNTVFCKETNITLSSSGTNLGSSPAYQWTRNGQNVSNGPSLNLSNILDGDIFKLQVTSSAQCASLIPTLSNSITMTVLSIDTPSSAVYQSASSVCINVDDTLYAFSTINGATIQWQKNNNNIPGAMNDIYVVNGLSPSTDNYRFIATMPSIGCYSKQKDTSVNVPITIIQCGTCLPDITISTSPFTTALTESQTWIKTSGTVLIPLGANVKFDANASSYVQLNPGFSADYGSKFLAQAYNGCTAGSPQKTNSIGTEQTNQAFDQRNLILYPNPTSGKVTLMHPKEVKEIQVFDMVGKRLLRVRTHDQEMTELDLSEFPNGIYHVRTEGFTTIKVIKH